MDEVKTVTKFETNKDMFVVEDGYKEIPVYNSLHMQIGTLRYNPTDLNIVGRLKEKLSTFENILKPVTDASVDADGNGGLRLCRYR